MKWPQMDYSKDLVYAIYNNLKNILIYISSKF